MPESSNQEQPWQRLRREMPVAERMAYFDHAAVAPLSAPARAAMTEWTDDVCRQGALGWSQWIRRLESARRYAAELVRAGEDEIALVPNTTAGVNLVAEGFPWTEGDNVVTFAGEFPSNRFAWQNLASRGVEVRQVPTQAGEVCLDDVAKACDRRTRIVAVSWVGFATGWRNDLDALAELAHRHGGFLFVDAIQGLGVLPLDVSRTPIDFFAADGHKWLLSVEGAGVCYIRREHLERLRPLGLGWNSVVHTGDFDRPEMTLKSAASRYEGGTYNVGGFAALGASLELLAGIGVDVLAGRIDHIAELACERLRESGATIASCRREEHRSGIIAFDWPDESPQAVRRRCLEAGVMISCRGGRLRISPHAYNDESDVARLIEALR